MARAEASDWWNNTWPFRQSHVINAIPGAGTNYQINLTVFYGAGVSVDNDVYCNSHCQTDFDDLRFIDIDNSTELSYWIESYTASVSAFVWVELLDSLASDVTFWVYYGNTGAPSTMDGEQTFLFFDDFNDASINASKWTTVLQSPSEAGGYLTLTSAAGSERINSSSNTFGANTTFRTKAVMTDAGSTDECFWGYELTTGALYSASFSTYQNGRTITYTAAFEIKGWQEAKDDIYNIERNGTANVIFTIDSNTTRTIHTVKVPAGNFCIGGSAATTYSALFDWVFVRNYNWPEATHGAWGAEEDNSVYITFYYNSGGLILTNGTSTVNGSSAGYANVTTLTMIAVVQGNNSYSFDNWTYLAVNSYDNPFNWTLLGNATVWGYFAPVNSSSSLVAPTGMSILWLGVGGLFGGIMVFACMYSLTRKERNLSS